MHLLIGDLQGCLDAFERLLAVTGFSPSRDTLHVLGDLVNRGPASLATLRRLQALGGAAAFLLGNHDIHLLAVAAGVRAPHRGDTFDEILAAPDREALLHWLRGRGRLAERAHGWLLVHAGLVPQWDGATALALAAEVEALLPGPGFDAFLPRLYGNQPRRWDPSLQGDDRVRFIINVLTRIRFCSEDGVLDFEVKEGLDRAPAGFAPWFELQGRRSAGEPVAFGHWSTLGLIDRPDLLAIDTGCVWGRELTAVRVDGGRREIVQVRCAEAG